MFPDVARCATLRAALFRSQSFSKNPCYNFRRGAVCAARANTTDNWNIIMKDLETQEKFVELRAQDWTFARIAQELNVCKRTLMNWSRTHQFDIQNRRALRLEELREELLASRETRARAFAAQLKSVEEELTKRSVSDLSTHRLFSLAESLRRQIQRETGETIFTTPIKDIPNDEYTEQVQDWKP